MLIYAGTFLFEQHDICSALREKSAQGVRCRFLIGDESSKAVKRRAIEEGTPGGAPGPHPGVPPLAQRRRRTARRRGAYAQHDAVQLAIPVRPGPMVNPQVYGEPAGHSPVLHLRRVPGGRIWDHYMRSFEAASSTASPET